MNAAVKWWTFAAGLLGGRAMLGGALALLPALAIYLAWLLANDVPVNSKHYASAAGAAGLASMAFFGAVVASLLLWRFARENAQARLVPGLDRQARRIMLQALAYVAIMLPLALLFRAYAMAQYSYRPGELMSLAASGWRTYTLQFAWLMYVAALITVSVLIARLPLRYAAFALYMGVVPTSSASFMLKLGAVLLALYAAWWVGYGWAGWQRRLGNPRYQSAPELAWLERLRAWRLRRAAAVATRGGGRRFAALMRTHETPMYFMLAIILTVFYLMMAGTSSMLALPSFWMLAMTAAILALPQPMPVSRLMLLPRTATRASLRDGILRTWLTNALWRLAIALAIWLVLNTLFWLFEWRPFDMARLVGERPEAIVELVWRPLAHGAALAGTTATVCLLLSAMPHLLSRGSWIFPVTGAAAVVAASISYLLWEPFAVGDSSWNDPARLWRYAFCAGIITPLLGFALNRALAFSWRDVNVARLSSGMEQLAERLELIRTRGK